MPKNNTDNNGMSGADLDAREEKLLKRKARLDDLEAGIKARERELAAKESKRKQIFALHVRNMLGNGCFHIKTFLF